MKASARALAIASALALPCGASGQTPPDVKRMDGMWEGALTYVMQSPVPDTEAKPYEVRLTIRGNRPVSWEWRPGVDREWRSRKHFQYFRYRDKPGLLGGEFLHSGHDEDGLWSEHQSLILSRKNAETLVAYWVRVVNNVELPREDPDATWSWCLTGDLHRGP